MSLTKPSDYKGQVVITKNKFDEVSLQIYLDSLEPDYLRDLLGCELYDLFVADLALAPAGQPTTQRFIDIYNAICNDIESINYSLEWYYDYFNCYCQNNQNRSRGMIEMLKGFMYFEYVREQDKSNSSVGVSQSKGVASVIIQPANTLIKREYNKSLVDYWNIQYFIRDNASIYPEFNGITKQAISIL